MRDLFIAILMTAAGRSLHAAPPVVSISTPADGSVVSGMVAVAGTASSAVAISSVQFQLDWANLGMPDLSAPYGTTYSTAQVGPRKPIFDSMLFTGKPSLDPFGLSPIMLVYEGNLWPAGASRDQPHEATIKSVAAALPTDRPICVDIEVWSTSVSSLPATMAKLIQVATWIRQANPNVRFGFYGILPIRNYWDALNAAGNAGYDAWNQSNAMLEQVAPFVDYVFPSIYTFYNDQPGWQKYADANIQQARRYGKPVYVFLMPTYHDSNATLKGTLIAGDYWRRQINTTQTKSDGTVIWGGWQVPWNSNDPWWVETKKVADPAAQGVHALSMKAWDSSGQMSVSAPVYVIVKNSFAPSTDVNGDGSTSVVDVQLAVNQALGMSVCSNADVNGDGACNVSDVQRVVNAALGL